MDPGEALALCKLVQAESVSFSSLQRSEAQGTAATDTRGGGPPCPSTLARPLMQCQDPPCTAWWCDLLSMREPLVPCVVSWKSCQRATLRQIPTSKQTLQPKPRNGPNP